MLPILNALPGERRGYVDGLCGQLHYREQGSGPPLLLIHQGPWSSIQFHHVMPLLADLGLRVVALDLPGNGMSSPLSGEPTVEAFADEAAAALDALGIARCLVAGHHGGALVAGRLAAQHPDKVVRLAMDSAPVFSADELAGIGKTFTDPQDISPDGTHFGDRWARVRQVGDPEWSTETVHLSVVTYFLNGPWKEHVRLAAGRYRFEDDVPRIVCPTLSVAGRSDPIYAKVKRLNALRSDWEHAEFPGGSGTVFEHPASWCATIGDFLTAGKAG